MGSAAIVSAPVVEALEPCANHRHVGGQGDIRPRYPDFVGMLAIVRADTFIGGTYFAPHIGMPRTKFPVQQPLTFFFAVTNTHPSPHPRAPISYAIPLQPSLSAMLFTALAKVNLDHAKEKGEWGKSTKFLRKQLAKALCSKIDQANSAYEALKAGRAELEQERGEFRAFRTTVHGQLEGELQ